MTTGKVVSVFGSANVPLESLEYQRGLRLGQLLAEQGWTVLTGGFGGIMEAVSCGAQKAGGRTVGATLPSWGVPANPYVGEERPQATFIDRLAHVTTQADGYVALDGGIGTLTEIALTWSLLETHTIPARPFVAVGERWRSLIGACRRELILRPITPPVVSIVDTPEEAVACLRQAWSSEVLTGQNATGN